MANDPTCTCRPAVTVEQITIYIMMQHKTT